jgi:adenylate cyclase
MFGVEVHATAAANLLEGKWIRRGSAAVEAAALAVLSALLTLCLLRLRPTWGALMLLAFDASWAALAYYSFNRGVFLPGAALAIVVLPATYLGTTLWNYLTVRLQQLRLERAFRFYLSPEMAREIARNPEALKLGGEEVECTAMFTDIAGFTTIAEKMKPGEVSRMLNSYFTEVMDAVFEQRGTVIQFIGDGVYALWGAPAKTSEHARLCCEAALATEAAIERFNKSARFPPLRTRFGINTGAVLVGNLGSKRRFDFTGIGDTVNLASRLEGLNKYFGTTILITDSTRAQLPAEIASLKMGLIRAVGKTFPVGLHTLFREPVSATVVANWSEACVRFVARDWRSASELFAAIARDEPRLAKSVALYAHQIELHRAAPPPPEWQGEIIFTSK